MHHRKCIILLFISFCSVQAADYHKKIVNRVSSLQKLAAQKALSSHKDMHKCVEHLPPDVTLEKYMVRQILKPYKNFLTLPQPKIYKTNVRTFAYHPHGQHIATSSVQDSDNDVANDITISDIATEQPIALLKGHIGDIGTLAFNGDGTQLASGGEDSVVRIWDCRHWKEIKQLQHAARIYSLCFNPQVKQQLASIDYNNVIVCNIETGQNLLKTLGNEIAYNPSGTKLAIQRHDVAIYDTKTWQLLQRFDNNNHAFYDLAYSVNDQLAMGGRKAVTIEHVAQNTQNSRHVLKSAVRPRLAYNPKGDRLIVGGDGDFETVIWDTSSWSSVLVQSPKILQIAYHPHNKQFAVVTVNDDLCICKIPSYKKMLDKLNVQQAIYLFANIQKKLAENSEIPLLQEYAVYDTLPYEIKNVLKSFMSAPGR